MTMILCHKNPMAAMAMSSFTARIDHLDAISAVSVDCLYACIMPITPKQAVKHDIGKLCLVNYYSKRYLLKGPSSFSSTQCYLVCTI